VQTSVAKVQVQPVPLIAVAVNPVGSVSVTVTVPVVEVDPLFVTVMVYCAPVCPCVKLPTWLFVIVRSGWEIVVRSSSVLLAVFSSVPPDTDTDAVLVTVGGALLATVTVRLMFAAVVFAAKLVRVQVRVAGPVAGSVLLHVQPLPPPTPAIAVAVRPAGKVSVTVIVVPDGIAAAPLLVTVIV